MFRSPADDGGMEPDVIVLNGGSSSGKSSLGHALQGVLDGVWLRLTVDTLIDACPPALLSAGGLDIAEDGAIDVGARFTAVELSWMAGVAAIVRAGTHVIVEDSFLSGPSAQQRWRYALASLDVVWVGVRLAPELARERERLRGDRNVGMAELQAASVHEGIVYDIEIDTSRGTPAELAEELSTRVHAFIPASGMGHEA